MNEKDERIERLFDDYASSLEPATRLTGKAMEQMRAKRKPKRRAVVLGSLAAVCGAFLVFVLAVTTFIGVGSLRKGGNGTSNPSTSGDSNVTHYSVSEIRASKVDERFAADYINVDEFPGAQVFSRSYYACYLKESGEFVYLKAVLGVDYDGGNVYMTVVAEKSSYESNELSEEYKRLKYGGGYIYDVNYVKGEYVTRAYLKTAEYRYYVSAMGNVDGAQDIAEYIINIR